MSSEKKYPQADYNKRSMEKRGVKVKSFTLDLDTIALLERLAAKHGLSQVAVLKAALQCFDQLG